MHFPRLSPDMALFLDFDGTLAPIREEPDCVYLPPEGAEILLAVSARLEERLVILSGRDVRDLTRRVPQELWRAGGHGAQICAPGTAPSDVLKAAPPELVQRLQQIASPYPGVVMERKGEVLALHYRGAAEAGPQLKAQMSAAVAGFRGYSLQTGKMVIEARPDHADKGKSVAAFMRRREFSGRVPLMIGDDTTDEAAMQACLQAGGAAIKVGAGASVAPFRLDGPEDVWNWLREGLN